MIATRETSWVVLALLVLLLMVSAQGQQPEDTRQELTDFLPNAEGKALIIEYCTRCHSTTRIRQAIAQRAGGNESSWSTLVGQMITVWNAPIPEEHVPSIVTYLSTHFGPSSRPSDQDRPSPLQADPDEELNTFLPDDEGKVLLTVYCRGCHSATQIRRNLAQRAGGNENYWNALVQRMMTVWNAPIAEEDVAPIVTYLSKHFGSSWVR